MTQPPDPSPGSIPAASADAAQTEAPTETRPPEEARAYGRPQGAASNTTTSNATANPVAASPVEVGSAPRMPVSPAQVKVYPMKFTGTPAEYFRIWIVNLALSVVTLGLYTPWARVRTRQYLYGNTWVDGHNFEYTANPWALLRGYLIVAVFFAAYNGAIKFQFDGWEWVAGTVLVIFFLLYPWMVRQSLKFLARSSVHRGLNFSFVGTLGGAYLSYGLANLVASVSGALGLPWAWFMQRQYQIENLKYGQARAHFRGDAGQFYLIGLSALGVTIGGAILLGLLGAGIFALFSTTFDSKNKVDDLPVGVIAGIGAAYVGFLLLYGVAWQYMRAAVMKYVLNNVELGGVVRLSATFSPWRVVWIGISNFFAQIFTLGLLTPWGTVRRMNYVMDNIRVRSITNLDDFSAENAPQENALGEAATELLDINLGF